jgi:hypothetical protein
MADDKPFNLAQSLDGLKPKDKLPRSASVLNTWITQAEKTLSSDGGRLGWLIASTVVAAALQQAVDEQGRPSFLLKGGTLLQHRLPGSRTTTDVDGLIRGDIDAFLEALDIVLRRPWGPLTFKREPVEVINVPNRVIKPRRFDVLLLMNGSTWRRLQVEISPDEGRAGQEGEPVTPPSLAGFGIPTPENLVGLAIRYQIAQKVHAASDPHDPPDYVNDRARDVVDLILLRDLVATTGAPTLSEIREAILDIFSARAADAAHLGLQQRLWPARLYAYPHWHASFLKAAESGGITLALDEAVADINTWLDEIDFPSTGAGSGQVLSQALVEAAASVPERSIGI